MPRVVSLLPSATEIVCALGLGSELVGRSHECDYPPGVERLPALTAPKFNVEGTSAEIDRRVKSTLENALSVYRVDADRLLALEPDVIVTQSQCEVCAVSMPDLEEAVSQCLGGSRPAIVSLTASSVAGVFADIARAAAALSADLAGARVVTEMQQRMHAISTRAVSTDRRPSVACIEWIDPLMAAGNWMPELIAMAGGTNMFGEAGSHSPWLTLEQLASADPELILVSPCGFDIERSMRELPALAAKPLWQELTAVKEKRVFVADGNQYFNRPGPRLVESLEILAEILHPDLFAFGLEGGAWRRF